MSTDTRLREAFDRLAERAPSVEELELDFAGAPARQRAREQHGRRLRVALAVAAVVLVAVAAVAVRWALSDKTDPPPAGPETVGPPTAFVFGPDSLPGYHQAYVQIDRSQELATYTVGIPDQPDQPDAGAETAVVVPGPDLVGAVVSLTPTVVQGVHAWVGEASGSRCAVFSQAPGCSTAVVVWPIDADHWAILSAHRGSDQTHHWISVSEDDLVRLAGTVRPAYQSRVAPLKVAYLPAGQRLVLAAYSRYLESEWTGYGSNGYQTLRFSAGGNPRAAEVNVTVVREPQRPLSSMTGDWLTHHYHPGPWQQTTVRGHLAWVSPADLLIQWDSLLVEVDNGAAAPDNANLFPHTPEDELLKVANSLTVPTSDDFGTGYPLSEALPPGTGW